MRLSKKILKIIFILIIIFSVIIVIDLINSKINNVSDISNLKKIKMYDENQELFYEINNLHESSYIELEDINNNIIKTFVNIEDKRFYQHNGYDIPRIIKAFFNNISGKNIIGASTITQQYVKNIYLSNEQTITRKIRELYYAIKLESIYSKDEILEGYLNTIYFNHGVYGIYDACKYYFNKEPNEITLAEAAVLTAIIKAPKNYSPITNKDKNTERKNLILKTLLQDKIITQNEFDTAINQEIIITKTKYKKYSNSVLFYKDLVLTEIEKTALNGQNIEIYTSFNISINQYLDSYIKQNNINSDLGIIILNNSGEIVASLAKDYYESTYNSSTNSLRMIGSTIKPMLYYEALNFGLSPLSTFTSEPTTFYINHEPYTFNNFNNKYQNGKITMAYAIAVSDNIYAVKTHLYIGSKMLISFLNKFNIDMHDNYPSLALGTAETSLLNLCSIYNTFSRLGVYSTPKTIRYINTNNKKYIIKTSKEKQLLKASTSYVINDLLTYTFDTNLGGNINPTGASIAAKLQPLTSAKTGLTDYDSYMIGYTPYYTVGIWTGNNDYELHNDTFSKTFPKGAFLHIMNFISEKNKNIWYELPNDVYSIFTSPTGFNDNYSKTIYLKR